MTQNTNIIKEDQEKIKKAKLGYYVEIEIWLMYAININLKQQKTMWFLISN